MNPANSSMSSTARRRRPCEDIEDIYANVVCSDEIRAGEQMMQEEQATPLQHNMRVLVHLSRHESYCDITFHNRDPLLGVRLSPALNAALMYGAGTQKMTELFDRIETRSGAVFRAVDVWVIVEFPNGLPSDQDLSGVDLADGDAEVAPGVSIRQMAKEVYRCGDDAEAEKMLRRILAA